MTEAIINQLHSEIQRLQSDLNVAHQLIEILENGNAKYERLLQATIKQLEAMGAGE